MRPIRTEASKASTISMQSKITWICSCILVCTQLCGQLHDRHLPGTTESGQNSKDTLRAVFAAVPSGADSLCRGLVYGNIEFFTTLQYVRLSYYASRNVIPCAVKLAVEGDSIAEDLLLTLIELRLDRNLSQPEHTVALPIPKYTLGHLSSARALAVTYKYLSYNREIPDDGHGNCGHYGNMAFRTFVNKINKEKALEYTEQYNRLEVEVTFKGMLSHGSCAGYTYIHSILFPKIRSDWENGLIHLRSDTDEK